MTRRLVQKALIIQCYIFLLIVRKLIRVTTVWEVYLVTNDCSSKIESYHKINLDHNEKQTYVGSEVI